MTERIYLWFFLAFLLLIPHAGLMAATLDCSGGIISEGDARADVLAKCGEPDWKDSHVEEFIERLDQGARRKIFVTVEEWTYNLGPNRFTRILTFRNGKLVDIRTGGYGYELKPEEKKKAP